MNTDSDIQREISEVADAHDLRVREVRLMDDSKVYDLLIGGSEVVHCPSEAAAHLLRHEIATAIHKATR